MKSNFINAKVVGDGIGYNQYSQQPVDKEATEAAIIAGASPDTIIRVGRGNPKFTMGRSELVEFFECAKKWVKGAKKKTTAAMENGSLFDCILLQPDKFDELFVFSPDTYTNPKGDLMPWSLKSPTCREWEAAQKAQGLIVISQKEFDSAVTNARLVMEDEYIASYIACSKKQVMATADYVDEETGIIIPVRVLTDLVPDPKHTDFSKSYADFKTAANAEPDHWENEIFDKNYHTQGAMNLDIQLAARKDVPESDREAYVFKHLIQESVEPFITARRNLSSEFIEIGRAHYTAALKLYAKCLKHKFWCDYEVGRDTFNGFTTSHPKPWMISQSFERHVNFPKPASQLGQPELVENVDTPP